MSRFKVGDRVVVIRSYDAQSVGAVSTVADVRPPASVATEWIRTDGTTAMVPAGSTLVGVDGGPLGFDCTTYFDPWNLAHLPDDGHLRGEWDELAIRCCKKGKVTA